MESSANREPRRWGSRCHAVVRRLFPARQILVRDNDRVRCLTLTTWHQIFLAGALGLILIWGLGASLAWMRSSAHLAGQKESVAHRVAELEMARESYQSASRQLDRFQGVFAKATCEIADIQDSLARIAEHGMQADKPGAQPALPRLKTAATVCRIAGSTPVPRPGEKESDDAEGIRQRIAQLQTTLEQLRASHGAFLIHTSNVTSLRIGQLERTLKKVGFDLKTLTNDGETDAGNGTSRFGRGGPFITALPEDSLGGGVLPVALFNSRASLLDSLNEAVRFLPLTSPVLDYELTSPFGGRNDPINLRDSIHEGMDMGAPMGTPVMATGDGVVVWAGFKDRYGNLVEIDHGMGLKTRYAHLQRVLVREGQTVSRNAPIGLLGNTGRSTGPHLHYEVRMNDRAVNPMKFIRAGLDVLKVQ